MATWPSGTKASTANLDAGTDKPSLARPDIKQNVDNVNDIIDMFNITSPSDGQILKYNLSNTRFELAADSTGAGGITSVTAGTGISVDQTSEGGVTITNTVTDTNTTYTISAEADGANANLRLTGSDASTDDIQLVAGTNITLTVDSAGAVTIDAAAGSGGITTVTAGTNIDVTEDSAGGVTVNLESVVDGIELKDYKETVYSLGTTSGTITPDVANGNVQTITLSGNLTFSAFSNPEAGQSLTLIIDMNGTGRTLTSTMLFAGGDKTISTTDTVDIISVFYDGTTYYASLAKDFS